MLVEGFLQLGSGRLLRELRQRLGQLLLSVVNVLDFVFQQIAQCVESGHGTFPPVVSGVSSLRNERACRSKSCARAALRDRSIFLPTSHSSVPNSISSVRNCRALRHSTV